MTNHGKHRSRHSLPHCLFRQPPTPGPLPSMMQPLFPCLSPAAALRASLPPHPMGRLIRKHRPPPALFPLTSSASPLLPQIDIRNINHERRGKGEYFVWFALYLTQNSPRDVRRDGVCCSLADLSSQNCGGVPDLPLPDRYRL
jgi:hypothetical protein